MSIQTRRKKCQTRIIEEDNMEFSHDSMLELSKVWGLLYLFAFSIAVVIYTFWPSNRARFAKAETEIFDKDDAPWK